MIEESDRVMEAISCLLDDDLKELQDSRLIDYDLLLRIQQTRHLRAIEWRLDNP